MKFKLFFALLLGFMFVMPTFALAIDEDMAAISCAEFIDSSVEDRTMLIFWIDGYLSHASNNTFISTDWLETLTTHMFDYCENRGSRTIMDAMDALP